MSARSPSMQEASKSSFEYEMRDVYTAIPAIVVSVKDLGQQRIDVQPALNQRSRDGVATSPMASILNVPLQMPVTSLGGLTYPIKTGDSVFLIFSMRGLDVWKRSSGGAVTPSDVRQFDARDCVAIVGVYPFNIAPNSAGSRSNSHSTDDVVLVHNIGSGAEVEIRLQPNGNVIINSPNKVEVNCKDAEIKADSSTKINTGDFRVDSDSFVINTGTYSLSASDGATQAATINMSGSFILNGTPVESHDHGGIQPGGSRTNPFGS